MFVLADKFIGNANVPIGNFGGGNRSKLFVMARGLKVLAVVRAIDRVFALRTAALRANIASNARAVSARASLVADLTGNVHRRMSLSYHRGMPRTDLYLKVELDLDEKENPERIASEICRTLRKLYGVRYAEVSSMVEKDA